MDAQSDHREHRIHRLAREDDQREDPLDSVESIDERVQRERVSRRLSPMPEQEAQRRGAHREGLTPPELPARPLPLDRYSLFLCPFGVEGRSIIPDLEPRLVIREFIPPFVRRAVTFPANRDCMYLSRLTASGSMSSLCEVRSTICISPVWICPAGRFTHTLPSSSRASLRVGVMHSLSGFPSQSVSVILVTKFL